MTKDQDCLFSSSLPTRGCSRVATTLAAVLLMSLSVAAGLPAHAQQVYVSDYENNTVGEYTLNSAGTAVSSSNPSLVTSGLSNPEGLVVSGSNLYVGNDADDGADKGFVAQFTLNSAGTAVSSSNPSFLSGLNGPGGLAISGSNLYVSNTDGNTVAVYTLNSTGTVATPSNLSLITTGLNGPEGLVVSGSNLYVVNYNSGTIGVYTLNSAGTAVIASNSTLVTGLNFPLEIALSGSKLFVANNYGNTVGQYTLNSAGTGVSSSNPSFLSGLNGPAGLAISGSKLFVTQQFASSVSEYTTSGATVNASLITTGLNQPAGLAVVPPVPLPGAALLFPTGLGVLALAWRTRRTTGTDAV